ncbi:MULTISPECIES: efflux RND transporter periplasmic adaptor subunit [Sphingopyxis]|jgi:cobalt-zinc-cadmium efflux system membrane fusion protein|uniref:Membrane fusion protein, cobalt-zinc-cadmium efflux system n=1 Tax=Sphingopyxis indica TaxID=436663 RepID=A0A239KC07_9SPHN|nr:MULTISPECIES: HlyD family efflux transporter periplasmic adaptor subunit [Sphingopyxis]KTE18367.1 cation transporter [Sphingopyxis sp. H050]SNT14654.1 membrane fusion protein, cobalt-zinc-cadmium efflux system [Sphingopyxis indica]
MNKKHLILALPLLAIALLASCSDSPATKEGGEETAAAGEYERGPHRGRMLRDGDFALEITIFEDGVDPEFRVYAYRGDKPVKPGEVQLSMQLVRLGGKIDTFAFTPQEDFLRGSGVVTEPHSFDVRVAAAEGGRNHKWSYQSYEGRTVIDAAAAKAGGIKTEAAGPATVSDLIDMGGRIEITPEGKADVRARLPGLIVSLSGKLGQQVRRGQVLARVESSHSLQVYTVTAPISGTIVEKNVNVGDTTGDRALFVIADPTRLHAEFFVYPRDAERIGVGQPVTLKSLSGEGQFAGEVEAVLPTADVASQTMMAHVHLPPAASREFRPGMGVEGSFAVAQTNAPIAVRTKAIQRFRDFEVVFAKVGNTYEVRMLEIGRRTPEWTEVLGGLAPGEVYVTDGAFLIRADIEKSGASHDH